MLIQIYESSVNVLRKTLTTNRLVNRRGEPWSRSIEDISPITLLEMLKKYSLESVEYIQEIVNPMGTMTSKVCNNCNHAFSLLLETFIERYYVNRNI